MGKRGKLRKLKEGSDRIWKKDKCKSEKTRKVRYNRRKRF